MHTWVVIVVGIASPSDAVYGGRGQMADAPKRWGIPPGCHYPGTHPIWWWSHQSTVVILLPLWTEKKQVFSCFLSTSTMVTYWKWYLSN